MLVDVADQSREGVVQGVGEDQAPRNERDPENDGQRGERQAQLVGEDALEGDLPMSGSQRPHPLEDRIGRRGFQLVDNPPVGEEHDPVGVGRHRADRG